MKTTQPNNEIHESTYALLVRSEEKERSLFETFIYGLVMLSAVAVIWQLAHQAISVPLDPIPQTASVTQTVVAAQS